MQSKHISKQYKKIAESSANCLITHLQRRTETSASTKACVFQATCMVILDYLLASYSGVKTTANYHLEMNNVEYYAVITVVLGERFLPEDSVF